MDHDHELPASRPLADVVNQLRRELGLLQDSSVDQPLRFRIQEAEIELQVALTVDAAGKLTFNCWLFGAEVGGSGGSEQTQTIRLKLKPENQPSVESGQESSAAARSPDVLIGSQSKSRS